MAASDKNATSFYNNFLPTFNQFISAGLDTQAPIENFSALELDPSKLIISQNTAVLAFFITEGTDYHNTLGFSTSGGGVSGGNPLLIFPDSSTSVPYAQPTSSSEVRTVETPLLPGDFVDLGRYQKNTQLAFFLIADGAQGGTSVYSTQRSINPDGLVHSYAVVDSPYLIMGFDGTDDSTGGQKDLVFALEVGVKNVDYLMTTASITHAAEPSTLLVLAFFLGVCVFIKRRQERGRTATG